MKEKRRKKSIPLTNKINPTEGSVKKVASRPFVYLSAQKGKNLTDKYRLSSLASSAFMYLPAINTLAFKGGRP